MVSVFYNTNFIRSKIIVNIDQIELRAKALQKLLEANWNAAKRMC